MKAIFRGPAGGRLARDHSATGKKGKAEFWDGSSLLCGRRWPEGPDEGEPERGPQSAASIALRLPAAWAVAARMPWREKPVRILLGKRGEKRAMGVGQAGAGEQGAAGLLQFGAEKAAGVQAG